MVMRSGPKVKIGTSKREDAAFKKLMASPSPTNYNPTDRFTKIAASSWGFGSMKRPVIGEDKTNVPGPQYDIPQMLFKEGPKYVMGSKGADIVGKHLVSNPGPG
jgi:hypothetical protein